MARFFVVFIVALFFLVGCDNPFQDDGTTNTVYVVVEVFPPVIDVFTTVSNKVVGRDRSDENDGDIVIMDLSTAEIAKSGTKIVVLDIDRETESAWIRGVAGNTIIVEYSHDDPDDEPDEGWQEDLLFFDLDGNLIFSMDEADKNQRFICSIGSDKALIREQDGALSTIYLWDASSGLTDLFPSYIEADWNQPTETSVSVYAKGPVAWSIHTVDRITGVVTAGLDLATVSNLDWFSDDDNSAAVACGLVDEKIWFYPADKTFNPVYGGCEYFIERLSRDGARAVIRETWKPKIEDYPGRFSPDGAVALDFVMVVGETAPASDVVAAVDIAAYLLGQGYTIGPAKLDTELQQWEYFYTNIISVGHPSDNDCTEALNDGSIGLTPGFTCGIKAYNYNGYAQIIVTGETQDEVRRAANVLCDPTSFDLAYDCVTVDGTGPTPSTTAEFIGFPEAKNLVNEGYYYFDIASETKARMDFSPKPGFEFLADWEPELHSSNLCVGSGMVLLPGDGDYDTSEFLFYDIATGNVIDVINDALPGDDVDDIDLDGLSNDRALFEVEADDSYVFYFDGVSVADAFPTMDYAYITDRSNDRQHAMVRTNYYDGSDWVESLVYFDLEAGTQTIIFQSASVWAYDGCFSPDNTKYVYRLEGKSVCIYDTTADTTQLNVMDIPSEYNIRNFGIDNKSLELWKYNPDRQYSVSIDAADTANFGKIKFVCLR